MSSPRPDRDIREEGIALHTNKLSRAARIEQNWGWFMVAPTIIGLLVLNVWPFIQTIYASFCEHLGFGHYKFIGLGNYINMFFLPMVCAPAAVTMVWRWIFNADYGVLNQIFGTHVKWITDPNVALISCAIVAIWSSIGYDAVLLLSGLQNISKSYYEAASIDGASKITQFFKITLPMVSPTLFVVMIMRLMSAVKVYDLIYMMVEETNPALTNVQSLIYLFYRESFVAGSRGSGSAIAVWTVLIIGIATLFQFWGQKKWVNYEI